jgi:hypothetical protein
MKTLEKALQDCIKAHQRLIRAYVSLLESGHDRIIYLGGKCDPVDQMEASDPALREAKAAITQAKQALDQFGDANKMVQVHWRQPDDPIVQAIYEAIKNENKIPTGPFLEIDYAHPQAKQALEVQAQGEVLSSFQDGQWWITELDAMTKNGTPDQKRAVAVVRNLLRVIATHPQASEPAWMPIETAPKDGSSYLVWAGGVGMAHYVDYYQSGYAHKAPFSENLAAWKAKATHWMPLPAAPEAK